MDDFSEVTPELIHSAYVEAVYREDEWEYERLTLPFWKNMIKQASESQSSDIFYHHFPLKSGNLVDIYFLIVFRAELIWVSDKIFLLMNICLVGWWLCIFRQLSWQGSKTYLCYSIVTVERVNSYKLVNTKNIKVMNRTQPVLSSQPHPER